ncbi:mitochondrial protein required for respiration [Mycena belliarum]|uniref:SURF1-like protein n=1 Tax=Mycena belliarum TaxID=1033014 RepID=A0AAD6XW34_9AGAR|nr:mitochondrial protein required for respiration [Mycena belliae]
MYALLRLRRLPALPHLSTRLCPQHRYIHRTNDGYRPRRDPWVTPTMILLGFVPIFTFGLGTWQLQRLQWKVALIDELEEKLQLHPLSLPRRINLSVIPEFVFRKVFIRGKWDNGHSMLVGPRTRDGVHGANVVTPLIREDGSTIIVDRGFISIDFDLQSMHSENGEVQFLGMLRTSQERNTFTPDNHPERGEWYWKDLDAMAEYAGGSHANVQPVLVEEIFEGHEGEASTRIKRGIPVGRPAKVDLRNAHLSYVITWYSLSFFTAIMFLRVLFNKKKSQGRQMPR